MQGHPDRRAAPYRVGVMAYPACSAWLAASIRESLELAVILDAQARTPPVVEVRWIAARQDAVCASADLRFDNVSADAGAFDMVVVPPLWHASAADFHHRLGTLEPEIELLRCAAEGGTELASLCSGVALLARAGVLDGRSATGCWWLEPTLRRRFPQVDWQTSEAFVRDGPVLTAGSGTSYASLAFHVLVYVGGRSLARRVADYLGMPIHHEHQAPFASLVPVPSNDDPLAAIFLRHVRAHLNHDALSVNAIAAALHTSARTLFRRVRGAFGKSPNTVIQLVRLEQAKAFLADTDMSIEQVCGHCGWADAASFRKLFQREVGLTPTTFRKATGMRRRAAGRR